jgi:hypothetical protein
MKTKITTLLLALTVMLLSACTDNESSEITKTHDNEGVSFTVKPVFYDSPKELNKAFEESGLKQHQKSVEGWSGWNDDGSYCEIHVLRLRSTDDSPKMLTYGHEFVHCVYGSFHSEGTG